MLAGPDQVENRLHIDSNQVTPLLPSNFARGYFDWKDRIREEHGVGFGGGGKHRLFAQDVSDPHGQERGDLLWRVRLFEAVGAVFDVFNQQLFRGVAKDKIFQSHQVISITKQYTG